MGAMQMLNDGGSIALLSSATNLYQLLTFAQTLEQITAKDQAICPFTQSWSAVTPSMGEISPCRT